MPTILNGPSKFDLMIALMDTHRRSVEFEIQIKKNWLKVSISMVQREDGSGESWNFEGRTVNVDSPSDVKGYYSTRTRKGTVMFKT